jgi:hypothetical protein
VGCKKFLSRASMNLDDVAARRFAAALGEIVTGVPVAP